MEREAYQKKSKRLEERFAVIADEVGEHFSRLEAREVAAGYLRSLLSRVERKNSWQMAEAAGQANP